jgi:hypothetical protein
MKKLIVLLAVLAMAGTAWGFKLPGPKWDRFQKHSEGVILDTVTGRFWTQIDSDTYPGIIYDYNEAKKFCSSDSLVESTGIEGWRIPTKKELLKVLDKQRIPSLPPEFLVRNNWNPVDSVHAVFAMVQLEKHKHYRMDVFTRLYILIYYDLDTYPRIQESFYDTNEDDSSHGFCIK